MRKAKIVVVAAMSVALLCVADASEAQQTDAGPAAFSTGLKFADPAQYQSVPMATSPVMGTLPSRMDLSESFPAPGDQGSQSSCVGWAVGYALKGYEERQERQWALNTPDHLFSPSYVYNQIKQPGPCSYGSMIIDALNLITRDGVAPLSSFPYDQNQCSALPSAAIKQAARVYAIATWRRVNVQDETETKAQLAAGFPVVIGMLVDDGFMAMRGSSIYSTQSGVVRGGHALVVVGYDDAKQAYKVINSWGPGWGDQGFGWISYAIFRSVVREGYVAQDIVVNPQPAPITPTPVPPPSPGPIPPPVIVNPQAPAVTFGQIQLVHNIPGPLGPAMSIRANGAIQHAKGKSAQLVVRFTMPNGAPLFANAMERQYRDTNGLVATGTGRFSIDVASEDLSQHEIIIPYYALNFAPTGGRAFYNLLLSVTVYVDDFPIAQSASQPFVLTW